MRSFIATGRTAALMTLLMASIASGQADRLDPENPDDVIKIERKSSCSLVDGEASCVGSNLRVLDNMIIDSGGATRFFPTTHSVEITRTTSAAAIMRWNGAPSVPVLKRHIEEQQSQ
jgi:hypothetical protein